MQIQAEELYLFETSVSNPFFLGVNDGINTKFINARTIELININTVYFYLGNIAKSGITYSLKYGGEDSEISESYGKMTSDYTLEFNFPTFRQKQIEELIGKEFAVLGMRRDLSNFVIFGRFICENLDIDNEVQQRVRFQAKSTNARIYNVQSFNITNIINVIDSGTFDNEGFDYETDFALN
jgi:hypothetical protein